MSKRQSRRARRRTHKGQMPMSGAGLIRFYQDESSKIKVGPIATVLMATGLIVVVVWAWLWKKGIIPFP
ncbi:MAG: preprotein translocase subunit Sec61beta [Promethearchaeota archaeon]